LVESHSKSAIPNQTIAKRQIVGGGINYSMIDVKWTQSQSWYLLDWLHS